MNQEEFIERIQDWFSDVNIDTAKLNDYFEQKDFNFGAPHTVGFMRMNEIAVIVRLDRTVDNVTPGIHLELLEPVDENDIKFYLSTDEKKERPFFYGGEYAFQNIQECGDFQKLAEFVEAQARQWELEWAESKLRNLTGTIREDVNMLRNRWREGHEFPRTGTGSLSLVAEDGNSMVYGFGVFRDERHSGKLSFDIGYKNILRDINGQERRCDLVFTNGKLTIRTTPDGYSPFDGRAEGVEYFKPSAGDIKMFCGAFEIFHEEAQEFNKSILQKEQDKALEGAEFVQQKERLKNLIETIEMDVIGVHNRWNDGYEFPRNARGGVDFVADGGGSFGVFRSEYHPDKLSSDIGFKDVWKDINGQGRYCDLVFTNGELSLKVYPKEYSQFDRREADKAEFLKPLASDIEAFCDEFEAFHKEYEKFEEAIIEKEHWRADGTALTLTDEGRAKIADYHKKLDIGFVTQSLQKFYREQKPKALEKLGIGSDYKVDGNFLSLNFDPENPLVLEFKRDFVKTRVLDVTKQPNWVDDPAVRITYQQGNRVGTVYMDLAMYEDRSKFDEDSSPQLTASAMMQNGKIEYVPNLKALPLVEDQPFILQEIYRRSLSNSQGEVSIDEKNCGEFLSEQQKSVLNPEEYSYAVRESLLQEKKNNPLICQVIMVEPEISDDKPFITVFSDFTSKFTHEALDAKEMLLEADKVLMDFVKDDGKGQLASMTLEEALEKRAIDKEDFIEQVKKAAKSVESMTGARIADGAIRLEKQYDRKEAVKLLSGWMNKPGKKIAKDIKEIKYRNQVQGR